MVENTLCMCLFNLTGRIVHVYPFIRTNLPVETKISARTAAFDGPNGVLTLAVRVLSYFYASYVVCNEVAKENIISTSESMYV